MKKLMLEPIIDDGIGISDYRKKLIFQPGYRELKGRKGMGICLSLVSKNNGDF